MGILPQDAEWGRARAARPRPPVVAARHGRVPQDMGYPSSALARQEAGLLVALRRLAFA